MRLFGVDEWHEIIHTCRTDFERCEVKVELFPETRKEDEDEDEDEDKDKDKDEGGVGRLAMYVQLATGWRDIKDTDTGKGWAGLVFSRGVVAEEVMSVRVRVRVCFRVFCVLACLRLSTLRLLSKAHWGMAYGSMYLHVYW
jgi:hypothetical protein